MTTTINGGLSMQELLEAMLSKTADSSVVNPPTTGPGAGAPDSEETFTSGERTAENDAFIKETLGQTGAESSRSADSNTIPQHPAAAAPKLPTGEDPANQAHDMGSPDSVEPGTSLNGATLNEKEASFAVKTAAWREASAQLILELVGEGSPVYKEAGVEDYFSGDSPLQSMIGDDEKIAFELQSQITEKIASAHMEGRELARNAIACLSELHKQAAQSGNKQGNAVRRLKRAMTEMLAEPAGQGVPAEELGGGDMGGGMPGGEMGGGDMGGGEDPAVIEQAIMELANQMGVSPEELIAALEEAAAGGEMGGEMGGGEMGGGDMGGAPPMEAEPAPAPPAEESVPSSAEGGEEEEPSDEKTAKAKLAVESSVIRKRAREVVEELTRRGSRR